MAINLKSTAQYAQAGVKILTYGQAGAGKTTLIRTLPSPVVISAESGLLSLQGCDIPYIEVHGLADLHEAMVFLSQSHEGQQFQSIALDSISEIAEIVLATEKETSRDGRAAYGVMNDTMAKVIRAFRDLPGRNVYFSAKLEKSQTEGGPIMYGPGMPGSKLSQGLAYFFDEVLALRLITDQDGVTRRVLQTAPDPLWIAKDRSGRLDMWEAPDLGAVIEKISGNTQKIK